MLQTSTTRFKMPKKLNKKLPILLQACKELFDTDNLYAVLEIRREATPQEVKKGYHKISLAVHPDRVGFEDKQDATRKFQTLGKVYGILSNKEKRALYDESGDVGEDDDIADQDRDWEEYWRLLFPAVTLIDIKKFEEKYKGSADEIADLKTAYTKAEGNMDVILDSVLCSTFEDEPRFTQILSDLIKKGELPEYAAFAKESKQKKAARQKRATQEAKEAEEEKKKLKLDSDDALTALVQKRNASRAAQADSFFASLEAKYAQPGKGKKGKGSKKK